MGLTRSFLPSFRARVSGTIVMISSVDAWVGRPGFGAYTASKYALEGAFALYNSYLQFSPYLRFFQFNIATRLKLYIFHFFAACLNHIILISHSSMHVYAQ